MDPEGQEAPSTPRSVAAVAAAPITGDEAAAGVEPTPPHTPPAARTARALPPVPEPAARVVAIDSTQFETVVLPARALGRGEVCRDALVAPHHTFGMDASALQNLAYVAPGKVWF
jgi:hypothetical protein